jgi:hypothetical protein
MTTKTLTHNGRVLMERLLKLSSSPLWAEAKREWELEYVYLLDRHDEPRRCTCGHYPIRELCVLRNRKTGHRATVGNTCVRQFMGMEDADDVVNSLRRVREHPDKSSLSPAAAIYAHDRGWLDDWQLDFCLDTARKRKLSCRQRAKREEINRTVIIRMQLDARYEAEKPAEIEWLADGDDSEPLED